MLSCLKVFEQDLIAIFDFPDAQKSSFGGVREACSKVLGCLRQSWCVPGVSGRRLRCVLQRLRCVLEGSLGHIGASWEDLGGVLVSLGGFLGAF